MGLKVRNLNIQPTYTCQLSLYDNKGNMTNVYMILCEIRNDGVYAIDPDLVYLNTTGKKIRFKRYSLSLYKDRNLITHADYDIDCNLKQGDTLTLSFVHPFMAF